MAVRPVAAAVSVALPPGWQLADSQQLYGGMREMADAFDCSIVGGDTTGWAQRLAIDAALIGEPFPGVTPVRRDGAKVGDALLVTGKLGGSLLGRHLKFTPRVREARTLAEAWGDALHAMMDISDGLSLDLHRMCRASNVGAILEQNLLSEIVHLDAVAASERDERSPLEHALSDGEDFELLLAVDPKAAASTLPTTVYRVGVVTDAGLKLRQADGTKRALTPEGYEHLR
jgi:thiamine-monophosphate kinase